MAGGSVKRSIGFLQSLDVSALFRHGFDTFSTYTIPEATGMPRITAAITTVFSMLLCLFAPQLRAASFDCDRAGTVVERAVCDNFQLSVDDRVMSCL